MEKGIFYHFAHLNSLSVNKRGLVMHFPHERRAGAQLIPFDYINGMDG